MVSFIMSPNSPETNTPCPILGLSGLNAYAQVIAESPEEYGETTSSKQAVPLITATVSYARTRINSPNRQSFGLNWFFDPRTPLLHSIILASSAPVSPSLVILSGGVHRAEDSLEGRHQEEAGVGSECVLEESVV